MGLNKLLFLITKYNLSNNLIEWAGIFRLLGSRSMGFSLDDWLNLSNVSIQKELATSIIESLIDENLIIKNGQLYLVQDDLQLQRSLEMIYSVVQYFPGGLLERGPKMLWTEPSDKIQIPQKILSQFDYLFSYINKMIQVTNNRLIFFAPFYSVSGILRLRTSITAILNHKNNLSIDWIIGSTSNADNVKSISFILENFHSTKNNVIRLYKASDRIENDFDFHAKFLLSDSERGYLGSANFSSNGLKNQFELGVALDNIQTKSLTDLIDHWIKSEKLMRIYQV